MENKTAYSDGGMSLLGVIQIVFIILKLVGVITWSWPITLIPLWIELGAIVVMLGALLIAYLMYRLRQR